MRETEELTGRDRDVLSTVVQTYIERGEPVSSLWLTRHARLGVSSATVRNVLAKLERRGYLQQPHTSAGRVPTDLGYRSYVDLLLEGRRPARAGRGVEARLSQRADTVDEVLSNVSHELSRVSHCLGFAFPHPTRDMAFDQIQFVPIGRTKVLVVVVSTDGEIAQKAVDLGERVKLAELQRAANYVNSSFSGLPLTDVRTALQQQLREERILYDRLLTQALHLAHATFLEIANRHAIYIQGASSLVLEVDDMDAPLPRAALRAVLEMIEEKGRLIRLLSEYIDGVGLLVVIGAEHSSPDLKPFSLVARTYSEGLRAGTVGVIGPTRMRYSRTIAAVDGIAGALNRVLHRTGHDLGE